MSGDPLAMLLGRLDAPVAPRPKFAEGLLARLLEEFEPAPSPAGESGRAGLRLPRLWPAGPRGLRLVLIVLALLLLLAALALAAYFGVRTWVSAGARGVQYASGYRLALVYRDPSRRSTLWSSPQLAPGGGSIYAVHYLPPWPHRRAQLVRVDGVVGRHAHAETILDYQALATQSRLWDRGVDVSRAVVGEYTGETDDPSQSIAVAANGDVFVLVGAWRTNALDGAAPLAVSVIVRHRDGSLQKVLGLREFAGVPYPRRAGQVALSLAASAPGRRWIKAHALRQRSNFGPYRIFEAIDPNRDGDWSDGVVRPFLLPRSLPLADRAPQGWQRTFVPQLVAEPDSSLLLTTIDRQSEFTVYRVVDRDGDGDALDPGEATRVFRRQAGYDAQSTDEAGPPLVAQRGPGQGLVISRLTRPTRISTVSATGHLTDIGRSFQFPEDVLASGARIYVLDSVPTDNGGQWRVYRLERGTSAGANARTAMAAPPSAAITAPSAAGPRLAFTREGLDQNGGSIVTVSADGRGQPRPLVAGDHNDGFCQSADGTQIAFFSDQEAPGEEFVYVANADGGAARKITEQPAGFECGFSRHWLYLTHRTGQTGVTVVRHDLRTGANKTLARNVDSLAHSRDGTKLVYVAGHLGAGGSPAGRETLELLDLNTLARRRLAGPLTNQSYFGQDGLGLDWSPDGTRVAYMVRASPHPSPTDLNNPPPSRWALTMQDVSTGAVELRLSLRGGLATLSWSPDGNKLLVCLPNRGPLAGCTEGLPDPKPPGELLQVDLASHTTTTIARGELLWADWSPTGGYAYATESGIVLVSADGRIRRFALPPRHTRAGTWIGFSPDGRYLGLGQDSSQLGVLDLSTGKVHILYRETKPGCAKCWTSYALYRQWWPQKSAHR